MKTDYEHTEQADEQINDNLNVSTFDEVSSIMDYEKDSPTIQKDIKEFENLSSEEKNTLEDAVESVGHGFGFIDEESNFEKVVGDAEEQQAEDLEVLEAETVEEPVEEFISSAEFMLNALDILIIIGLNIYLKTKGLDKVSQAELKKEAIQQRVLVKRLAEVLKKHNQKISVELQFALALFGTYGSIVKNIITKQELRKAKEIAEGRKKPVENKVVKNSSKIKAKPVKEKTQSFSLNTDEEIIEENSSPNLDFTDEKTAANMGITPKEKIGIKA